MSAALIVLAALVLDAWFGEPRRYHPLVGFGNVALAIEHRIYTCSKKNGIHAVLLLVLLPVVLIEFIRLLINSNIIDIVVLYLAIGWNSLTMHARSVKSALLEENLFLASERLSLLVSRDTAGLNRTDITKGTIESVLENGNDAIFGAIFWFVVAGAAGVVAYRLINTLDAMWGYRNTRYHRFGWAAARLDDCLNYIPARLTALSYALMGNSSNAFACWFKQGSVWKSPNAGSVMAAGAGSLNISLGGPARYHGKLEDRTILGTERTPVITDIEAALHLIRRSLFFWLMIIYVGERCIEYSTSV